VLELAKLCDNVTNGLYALQFFIRSAPRPALTGSHAAYLEVYLLSICIAVLITQACLLMRSYEGAIPMIREVYADVKSVS
jgi:hypothetical protein